jgi:hypothetical protein
MWPGTFEERLPEWRRLRDQSTEQDLESALQSINDWWQHTPWRPYYLHWDDQKTWPDPWSLLADDVYCDLARALGIMYTIMLIERKDVVAVELVQTEESNLVLVNKGKYILNWGLGEVLNIDSADIKIKKRLDSEAVRHLLG